MSPTVRSVTPAVANAQPKVTSAPPPIVCRSPYSGLWAATSDEYVLNTAADAAAIPMPTGIKIAPTMIGTRPVGGADGAEPDSDAATGAADTCCPRA
jgi:hypothetical protein